MPSAFFQMQSKYVAELPPSIVLVCMGRHHFEQCRATEKWFRWMYGRNWHWQIFVPATITHSNWTEWKLMRSIAHSAEFRLLNAVLEAFVFCIVIALKRLRSWCLCTLPSSSESEARFSVLRITNPCTRISAAVMVIAHALPAFGLCAPKAHVPIYLCTEY